MIQLDIKDSHDMASCIRVKQLIDEFERAEYTIVGNKFHSPNTLNIREAFKDS